MIENCIFCKIIAKKIPAQIIEETSELLVITDINPKASIHYLIIPKKHLKNINDFENTDESLAGKMLLMAKELGKKVPFHAYRLVINNEAQAGQIVFHSHIHFLAEIEQNSHVAF